MRLRDSCFSLLDLFPQNRIGFAHRYATALKLPLSIRDVLINLCFMVEIEGNRAVNLGEFENGEILLYGLGRLAPVK